MSPAVAIVSTVVIVSCIFTVVLTVVRHFVKKFDAETRAQKDADERYRAARKS